MTTKTYPQLTATTSVADGDLFAGYSGAGPLKRLTALIVQAYMQDGTMLLTGAEPMTGALKLAVGTEALPGLTFDGDTDVGFYRIGANNFGATVGGVKQGEWSSRGYVARPSTTGGPGMSLPPGVAPTSPADGDIWTADALYVQINGVTVRLATASFIRINRSSDTTLTAADSGAFVSLTGTFAQTFDPCVALGDGWWCFVQSRTGVISYTPDGSEQIDGYDSIPGNPNEIRIVFCDGADLTSVVVTPFDALYTATGAILWPPGYSGFDLNALGGGGGGGSGARATSTGGRSSGGSSGGGGADKDRFVPSADITVNASTVVTVPAAAAGGASQTSQNSDGLDGADGGAAVVVAYLTANGGSKGLAGTVGNSTHAGGAGGSYFSTATTSETTSTAGVPSLYAGGFGGGSTPLNVAGEGVASVNGGSGGGGGGSYAGGPGSDLRAAAAGGSSASASGIGGGGAGGGTTQGLAGSPGVLRGVGGGGGAGRDSTAAAAGAGGAGGPGAGGGGGGVASGDNGGGGALATASGAGGTGGAPQVRIRGVI